jgi:hypothetical protein
LGFSHGLRSATPQGACHRFQTPRCPFLDSARRRGQGVLSYEAPHLFSVLRAFGPRGRIGLQHASRSRRDRRSELMSVDLKGNWTDADIAALIGSVSDDRDWRLEVDADGVADLRDKTANPTGPDYDETLHCFLEIWMQGTDFVGPSAAGDKGLVGKIANALRENYPTLKANKFVFVNF